MSGRKPGQRVNVFPDRLREIVELDEYLARLQRSTKLKMDNWDRRGMTDAAYITRSIRSRIVELRAALRKEAEALVLNIPIVVSALGVKGIWFMSLLRLLVLVDIEKADTPAALWRFCGLGLYRTASGENVIDTIMTTVLPGVVSFSSKAKREMGRIAYVLMRRTSPYRSAYDRKLAEYRAAGYGHGAASRRARRYMVKLWLKHLWRVWRRQEGLSTGGAHPDDTTNLAAGYGWL